MLFYYNRKCRLEGALVRGSETAVQYCPLDQLTGIGDTKWTLTSGDMLSFARQIALAMVRPFSASSFAVLKLYFLMYLLLMPNVALPFCNMFY
jgi:hypothetical protein